MIVMDHRPLLVLRQLPMDNDKTGVVSIGPWSWTHTAVHKSGAQHNNADALSRRPDPDAMQIVCDAPGATHTLLNTGTQMGMDNGPSAVCTAETPPTLP